MRDDLSRLFDNIIKFQNKKIELLAGFRNKEFELKHILSGRLEDEIIDIINNQNAIIEKIDICDFEVAGDIDKVKRITGIDLRITSDKKYISDETKLDAFNDNIKSIEVLLDEINRLREDNIETMKQIADETSQSGDDLNRIDKIKNRFSKDLRSSWF